ncbi:putative Type I protein exporter [Helianthus annuus]|uniref:Type I protein exporter n=1 Tax=Helianthus annuus TaxID=4232 RepID=A0A9K3DF72_HELAN|nr:putative Type I protein exporter [Helianthus annuus]
MATVINLVRLKTCTVALVGESGSGKSTVIQLLQRFYNPNSGCITLDGTELHKFQLKWLRLQMVWLAKNPLLFNDTIRANIAYGKDGDATEAEILLLPRLANAHNFISGLYEVCLRYIIHLFRHR